MVCEGICKWVNACVHFLVYGLPEKMPTRDCESLVIIYLVRFCVTSRKFASNAEKSIRTVQQYLDYFSISHPLSCIHNCIPSVLNFFFCH